MPNEDPFDVPIPVHTTQTATTCPYCRAAIHIAARVMRLSNNEGSNSFLNKFQAAPISEEMARSIETETIAYCGVGGGGDVTEKTKRANAAGWCDAAAEYYKFHSWWIPGRLLMLKVWDLCGDAQRNKRKHVNRSWVAHRLAVFENDWAQRENVTSHSAESYRWSLLDYADTALARYSTHMCHDRTSEETQQTTEADEGFSRHWLYAFGVHEREKNLIDSAAEECCREATKGETGWASPWGFAEQVLCKICSKQGSDALLMRRPKHDEFPFGEFPLSRVYLQALINAAGGADAQSERGKHLETLACYLFLSFGSCMPMPNVKDVDGASEHDLVVFNYGSSSAAFASRFGQHFLVECKNLSERASSSVIGYFLQRLLLTHCSFGVMLSKNGISGDARADNTSNEDQEERHARALIRRAFHENNITCIVVSLADLVDLQEATKYPSVSSMLFQLANEFQFGKLPRKPT